MALCGDDGSLRTSVEVAGACDGGDGLDHVGMNRWARGGEIPCYAGGCRNLGIWLIPSDYEPGRSWIFCDLHLFSSRAQLIARGWVRDPELLPFQDPTERPSLKRSPARVRLPYRV